MGSRIAVDIGGTFTDVVGFDGDERGLVIGKTLSTPADLIDGILAGVEDAGTDLRMADSIVHGSTVVINALIERKGSRAAIVTTRGFRDVYEIGRVNRPNAFDLQFEQHRPLVPRELVFEIDERIRASGEVHRPLDELEAHNLAQRLAEVDVEAIAVVLLHSYRNPEHEVRLGRILANENPDAYITLSHELSREYREFERTSTTAANAFVGPVVTKYLEQLQTRLSEGRGDAKLSIMQSNGGLSDVATIRRQAVQMMESGPAGGVVGTIELCKRLGYQDAIAFDMGGTTAKAAVVRDQTFPQAAEYFVGGYVRGLPIRIPCLDIIEVGTGGGSVAWLDAAGGLHVGPHSAGADPGPACYGKGGFEATVTDAAVVLGLLDAERALSGDLSLGAAAAHQVVARVADRVQLSAQQTAAGILEIAAASMANAVRAVTTERGLDPRDFALFAYGGNGPLHISLVARELGVRRVVVPPVPAVFSALGMLMADVRHDLVLTDIQVLGDTTAARLEGDFRQLEASGAAGLRGGGVAEDNIRFIRQADMRYLGQEHSLTIEVPDFFGATGMRLVKETFDRAHLERFSHSAPEEEAEIVSLRVSAIGSIPRPDWAEIGTGQISPPAVARLGRRLVTLDAGDGPVECAVYSRRELLAGNRITGPAAIEEGTTTTVLRVGDSLTVDPIGNLLIEIGIAS